MAKHRRKYEPAGGVVSLRWVRGWPNADAVRYENLVLAEVWSASLGYEQKSVVLSASVVIVTMDTDGRFLFGGEPLGERECRRWCAPQSVIHHTPLTLRNWPESPDAP